MNKEEIMEVQREAFKKGKVLYNTCMGVVERNISDLLNQPTEGLLYDLNRDLATVSTIFEEEKLLNEIATVNVIQHLHRLLADDNCCCGSCKYFGYEITDGTGICALKDKTTYCGEVCMRFSEDYKPKSINN